MSIIWEDLFSERIRRMKSSAIRELLRVTDQRGVISLGGGLPAPESFPYERFAIACQTVMQEHGSQALQYGITEGYVPLRTLIAERACKQGLQININNVLITTGSQQALDLLGKVFLSPGDCVVVEAPTYLGALQAWSAYGAGYLIIPSDTNGIKTQGLETVFCHKPKFIYVMPNFQNPSGVTLSKERREQLLFLAKQFSIPIVEDDPYRQLRFEGEDLPSLLALDNQARDAEGAEASGGVIYISTFSKILSPGIRLGWVIAPEAVIQKMVLAKQGMDLHTSSFIQMVAYEMDQEGYLEEHALEIRQLYRERRDAMLEALETFFPPFAQWTHPQGGLFLWCTLPHEIDTEVLLARAIQKKVAFVPGTPFYPNGQGKNQMRLNFSFSSPATIREAIARLGTLLYEYDRVVVNQEKT